MKSDLELQRIVMDELTWEPSIDVAHIGVSVESGVVCLSGQVKSFAEKWAAGRATQRIADVRAVTDEIVVKPAGEHFRSDAAIARAVLDSLEWNSLVPSDRIKVLVENGWVVLDGIVEFHYQREEAESAVRNLVGVRGLTNQLLVKSFVHPADAKTQIERALERSAEIDAGKISVEASGNKVTLRGDVRSWAERGDAEHAAWSAPGVSEVKNEIRIRPY